MRITYLIDFNCPYSYIGLKRLQKAVANLNLDAEWEMRSFELEPEAGQRPAISTAERYVEKYEFIYSFASFLLTCKSLPREKSPIP